jgi:protein TonB
MTAATNGLEGLEELFVRRPGRARASAIGTGVALALHVAVGVALTSVDVRLWSDQTVEMEVREPPPPPPEVRPEPPPPPPPPPEVKRVVVRHAPAPPPTEAPPPPSAEPPKANEAPPVFGVSMSSVVAGDGPGVAVPIGNTLMTKPKKAEPAPVQKLGGNGDGLPVPVPEVFLAEAPRILSEVKAAYPPEAQRMGIEGTVEMKLLLDENGDVRKVTITKPAGHGFDELAREALRKFKFSPAKTSDGKAVPTSITYTYRFEQSQ